MSKEETIEYELNTEQCVKVALYMYGEWQKAMQPPLFAYYSFPDWLNRLNKQISTPNNNEVQE